MKTILYVALLVAAAGYNGYEAKGHKGTTDKHGRTIDEYNDYKGWVSCGCHDAPSCRQCGTQPYMCNGDCAWNWSGCHLKETTPALESTTEENLTVDCFNGTYSCSYTCPCSDCGDTDLVCKNWRNDCCGEWQDSGNCTDPELTCPQNCDNCESFETTPALESTTKGGVDCYVSTYSCSYTCPCSNCDDSDGLCKNWRNDCCAVWQDSGNCTHPDLTCPKNCNNCESFGTSLPTVEHM